MPPPGFSGAYIRRKIQKTAGFWPSNRPLEHRGTSALHGGQVAPILRENTHLTGSASVRSLCGRQARQFTWTGVGTPMNPPPEGQAAPLLSVACARRVLTLALRPNVTKVEGVTQSSRQKKVRTIVPHPAHFQPETSQAPMPDHYPPL